MKHPRWRFALLALAGIGVLAWLAWSSRTDLVRVLRGVSPYWIAASVALGVALNLVYGLLFDGILAKYSGRPHPLLHSAVYLMSQPGKYLPGKLWQAAMQSIALGGSHTGVAAVGVANIELALAAVLHATGLGLASLWFGAAPVLALLAGAAGVLVSWAVVQLPSGRLLIALFPRLRAGLHASGTDTRRASAALMLALTAGALATNFGASWSLLFAANTGLAPDQLAHLLASLWLGIAASLLALPVPAGLGIREAAVAGLGGLLAPDVPAAVLISVALLARCWQLLVDVCSMLVGWLLWHTVRRGAPA